MDHGADARVGADRERAERTAARDEAVERLLNLALGRIGGVVHRLGEFLDLVGAQMLEDGSGSSEGRRVGKESFSTFRYSWSQHPQKKKQEEINTEAPLYRVSKT